jgi:SLT domain-containing protein
MSKYASMSDVDLMAAYKATKDPFGAALEAEGVTGQLADVARSIYQQESGSGKNTKTSNAGAVGGMQIIPSTFSSVADKGWDINDPVHNARAGIRYLKQMDKQSGGDAALTAAGYYGGPGGMEKARRGIAVSDPRNPNAPNTLQYGQQVAARLPQNPVVRALNAVADAVIPSAKAATPSSYQGMSDAELLAAYQQAKSTSVPPAAPEATPPAKRDELGLSNLITGEKPKRDVGVIEGTVAGVGRGVKDVLDTGAQWLSSGFDKIAGTKEGERVRAMNEQGKSEFKKDYGDSTAASVGRVGGNIIATLPVGGVFGAGAKAAASAGVAPKVLVPLGEALASGGIRAGGAGLGTRAAGGAITGGASAALVDPNSAVEGALIGGALPGVVRGAAAVGSGARTALKNLLGASTGTSAETVSAAYRAGQKGATSFLDNMRGNAEFDDIVGAAKAGLSKMHADKAAEYRNGMLDIKADKSVLDFKPITDAVKSIQDLGSFKGVPINKNAAGTVDDIAKTVSDWRRLNPSEYHTPEGLDALKRAIGDIRDATDFGTPGRRAADSVYNAVKAEISKQAPTYSKVMKDYELASKELTEITKTLSLGDKAAKDTAIRKLQSLMRNNAQTSYGNRLNLASQLEQKGGVDLQSSIAGQAMNTWLPRGMTGAITKGGGLFLAGNAVVNPATLSTLALMPATSPRVVGEGAYQLGRLSSLGGRLASGSGAPALAASPQALQLGNAIGRSLPLSILATQGSRQ